MSLMELEQAVLKSGEKVILDRVNNRFTYVPTNEFNWQKNHVSSKRVNRMKGLQKCRVALSIMPWLDCYNTTGVITLDRESRKKLCASAGITSETLTRYLRLLCEDHDEYCQLTPVLFRPKNTRNMFFVNPFYSTKNLKSDQVPISQGEWLHYVEKAFDLSVVSTQDSPKNEFTAALKRVAG